MRWEYCCNIDLPYARYSVLFTLCVESMAFVVVVVVTVQWFDDKLSQKLNSQPLVFVCVLLVAKFGNGSRQVS